MPKKQVNQLVVTSKFMVFLTASGWSVNFTVGLTGQPVVLQ